MADVNPIGVERNTSLSNLNSVVLQQEALLGPLVQIGNDGKQTLLSFDMDQDPPATPTIISIEGEGGPPGAAIVIKGRCFVSDQMTDIVAWRAPS
jgi:hypothetical protein